MLQIPGGERLEVSNLGKPFWPGGSIKLTNRPEALTKGDLFRHYVRVAPLILPVLADRPLVMKRYPNGIAAKPFYQHRAPDKVPPGVRIEKVTTGSETRPHLIGGALITLLYTAQLASISQDPWFSRVGTAEHDRPHRHRPRSARRPAVRARARRGAVGARRARCAEGARVPEDVRRRRPAHLRPDAAATTPYEAGLLFAQIVATMVAEQASEAGDDRAIARRRADGAIYVDYLQNALGKTLASAYSARASEFAGVSTPLTWDEVEAGVSPQDFTIANFAERHRGGRRSVGGAAESQGADLRP